MDHCASDLSVVNAARVSFAQQVEEMTKKEEGLIRFLMRERHGTPFEHGYFQFHVEAPIFVFREWHRHRTGHSYNEMSGRYVKLEPHFYDPTSFRTQHGKPGAYTFEDTGPDPEATAAMEWATDAAWHTYTELLERGIAKEQARAVLPVGTYSQMIWSCNPRSLMHFLGLRTGPSAMKEIRDCALEAEAFFAECMPVTHAAFIANHKVAP